MEQSSTPRKWMPRDSSCKMDFPPENGPIKSMVGLEDYMEIYAVHATYRVKTPENLDPERTVPNMPFSNSTISSVGASNPIVARVVIQSVEALENWPLRNGDRKILKRHIHACKEDALICEARANCLKGRKESPRGGHYFLLRAASQANAYILRYDTQEIPREWTLAEIGSLTEREQSA